MPPHAPALEARELRKSFGKAKVVALDGVSVTVSPGEVVGLVGPDGAGKTTLVRLCAGLLVADGGSLEVLGIDVGAEPLRVQEQVGYMPQRFGLYEDLTVQENLDLYADLQAIPGSGRQQRYQQLFGMTGLGDFKTRLAGQLSGGMKQKLGIACALIKMPRLLLLDEPTVGVDPVSRRDLWIIVRDMVREHGIGVLLSTAYLDEAERCDRVYVMNRGRIIESGEPPHFHEMVSGRVWELTPSGTNARQLRLRAEAQDNVVDASIKTGRVHIVTKSRAIDGISRSLGVAEANPVAPQFEDAFMHMMHQQQETTTHTTAKRLTQTEHAGNGHEVVVEVKDLVKRFGSFVAVDDISFEVKRGEVFGLLGPNGAGKTTTFRMLCGLLSASGGTLRVAGRDLRHSPGRARQRIGYMAQKFSLYGLLSAEENLRFFGESYGLSGDFLEQRITESLDWFDLADRHDEPADELPGGYKQRLAMAAALLHQPDVLFLDEPTSGVDPLARREFWSRITAAAAGGVTIIVTTHFMEEAEYCDRMLILSRGRPLALGTPAEIREHARDAHHRDPTIEDAFIKLAEAASKAEQEASHG